LILFIPILSLLFKVIPERIGIIIISVFVGHAAWHWMIERGERLSRFPFPVPDPAALASLTRWLMVLLVLAAIGWLVALRKRSRFND
ncbi:MAG TPA: hypothetical protein VFI62_18125, partial [Burkholderiales bacterium]|nr:hypothetical protein [Burkholderiales bacterium]